MNNTTYSVKGNEIESKWYILDAANKPEINQLVELQQRLQDY